MSQFVTDTMRKEFEFKKEELRKAYLAANQDEDKILFATLRPRVFALTQRLTLQMP